MKLYHAPAACSLAVHIALHEAHYLVSPLTAYPQLRAYLARVAQRDAVRKALAAEGLLK